METIGAIIGISLLIGLLVLKYLDGSFTYKDEVYSENDYTRTVTNAVGGGKKCEVRKIVIKRTYESGKIKFIEQVVEI